MATCSVPKLPRYNTFLSRKIKKNKRTLFLKAWEELLQCFPVFSWLIFSDLHQPHDMENTHVSGKVLQLQRDTIASEKHLPYLSTKSPSLQRSTLRCIAKRPMRGNVSAAVINSDFRSSRREALPCWAGRWRPLPAEERTRQTAANGGQGTGPWSFYLSSPPLCFVWWS